MEYSKETIENKNFLKRFSHQQRFVKSSELLNEYKFEKNISMLDFGSGDGFFIKYLIEKKFSFDFSAYVFRKHGFGSVNFARAPTATPTEKTVRSFQFS